MAKSDLKKVAPLWLEYSRRFRLDPAVRTLLQALPLCRDSSYILPTPVLEIHSI